MESTSDIFDQIRRMLTEVMPFNVFLGIKVDHLEYGQAQLSLPFRPQFIGDPTRPSLHAGIIATLLFNCGGAAMATTIGKQDRASTIDARIDYLRAGRSVLLIAQGHVIRTGSRVAVVNVRAFHADAPNDTVAESKNVYSILRATSEGAAQGLSGRKRESQYPPVPSTAASNGPASALGRDIRSHYPPLPSTAASNGPASALGRGSTR